MNHPWCSTSGPRVLRVRSVRLTMPGGIVKAPNLTQLSYGRGVMKIVA